MHKARFSPFGEMPLRNISELDKSPDCLASNLLALLCIAWSNPVVVCPIFESLEDMTIAMQHYWCRLFDVGADSNMLVTKSLCWWHWNADAGGQTNILYRMMLKNGRILREVVTDIIRPQNLSTTSVNNICQQHDMVLYIDAGPSLTL